MVAEEKAKRYMKRNTKGDASETGLIRFITPVLMAEYGGPIEKGDMENALEQIRADNPILRDQDDNTEYAIPFNSNIKFNLLIRDMNVAQRNPQTAKDNITVFVKGAPEKILKRVSKVLARDPLGKIIEEPYDEIQEFETEAANSRFGLMGERVLAFARAELDPALFKKGQKFDTKTWADWEPNNKSYTADIPGWFPMHGLTLVGLVSLNDPPRPKVDVSVDLCR